MTNPIRGAGRASPRWPEHNLCRQHQLLTEKENCIRTAAESKHFTVRSFTKTMGVCEEDRVLEHETMMKKEESERCVIAVLILVIIGLTAALIVVKTSSSTSCDLNNKVGVPNTTMNAPEITEIKNQKSAPCDDDWIWYRGKCYYFSTERNTWNNSEKFCNSHKSSLAIIENKEEKDFLFRYKGTDNHWIGIRRTDDNMAWTWTNGSLYDESLFKIKRTSQKNIECVYLNSENVESDRDFHYKWICNKT
ncbi:C-type lectin domain family 2 member B-like [Phyllobates terribilis]|uniref:C-type lectin domain family 2 member B-like n=1 Tax=Phyllobates terribilis TaxID=111132 RepID=UPI003CCAD570